MRHDSFDVLRSPRRTLACGLGALILVAGIGAVPPAAAQEQVAATEGDDVYSPDVLEELVGPIALYPDDLIAIILPAATYPLDIVEAARFLDEHEADSSLAPDEDWDDSIVALLNYPDVLRLMDEDLDWTWDLGEAFLLQPADVFDAVQRFREQARAAGNLASNERQIVREDDGVIEIEPADPKVVYVPYYEPRRVIVYHEPIYYYPRPYPVYYYPYPAGYAFHSGFFFGVTSAFVIGWHSHFLHVHDYLHVGHPYYRYRYYDPFFVRRHVNVNVVSVSREGYVWRPHYRHGIRPNRIAVTRYAGPTRSGYDTRRYATRSTEGRSDSGRRYDARSPGSRTSSRAATRQTARAARSLDRSTRNGTASAYAARNPRVADAVRQRERAATAPRSTTRTAPQRATRDAPGRTTRSSGSQRPTTRSSGWQRPTAMAAPERGPRAGPQRGVRMATQASVRTAAQRSSRVAGSTRGSQGSRAVTRSFGQGGQRR